jgi:DNA-binding PadR family transcriptional regulator
MERELDVVDMQLLRSMSDYGDIGPKNITDQRRLDRLELEGYVSSVRHDLPGLEAPPAWIYRLTQKGETRLAA